MRISRWPVLVCGWLLATVGGQTAFAFEPDALTAEYAEEDAGESYEDPSYGGGYADPYAYQPVQYMDGGGAGMPMYGADPYAAEGGYAPNYWPTISPYSQHNMEQLYNDRGVWEYEANDEDRKYLFGVEFLIAWGLRPGNQLISAGDLNDLIFVPPDDNQNTTLVDNRNIYAKQKTNVFSNLKHYGTRIRYGWENPDDSGFMLSGFYLADNQVWKVMNRNGLITNGGVNTGQRRLASIAYDNGRDGSLATFDILYDRYYDQQFWGADADVYASPFLRWNAFRLQFTWGAKYLRLFETLSVHAVDSNTTGDSAPVVGIPLETWITARSTSNLVGPQLGLRYDLGGNKFKIWGQTKVAVAANIEQMRVFGRNAFDNTDAIFAFLTGVDTQFDQRRNVTHISPILDQQIYGEFPLFAMIPLVNRIALLNTAQFRIGWSFFLVGEVSRPANIIDYKVDDPFSDSRSDGPTVKTNRTWFSLSMLSFAADWRF